MAKATMTPGVVSTATYNNKALFLLVGTACVAGFFVDLLVLSYPVDFGALEWRVNLTQQVADRSIILLFGTALLMAGLLDARAWRKRLATLSMVSGIVFMLAALLFIRDSSVLQKQALKRIDSQAEQAETRLDSIRENNELGDQVTPEQLDQLRQRLSLQAENLQGQAKTGILKTGISSVGNLSIIGLALIGLGRFGSNPPRSH